MGHYSVPKKIRRRKVANLASISRRFTVKHTVDSKLHWGSEELEKVKEPKWKYKKHTVPKRLHHAHKGYQWVKTSTEDGTYTWEKKLVSKKSEYPQYKTSKMTRKELVEAYIKEKQKKWDKKHPCPTKNDDLFKDEFIPAWKEEQRKAHLAIAQQVCAKYGNDIRLLARYEIGDQQYTDYKELTKVPDKMGEITEETSVNDLPKESSLIKKAKKITNAEKKRNPKLVATNLQDYKRNKGRIILPEAA